MKRRKARISLTTHRRSEHQQNAVTNNGMALVQDSAEIMPPSTKVSLQFEVFNFNFSTLLLRKSKAWQSWYNHQYSHTVGDDSCQDSMWYYMEEETGEDIFEDDGEQIDGEPNCVTVTGEESGMRDYGLMERLPWPLLATCP